MRIKTRISLIFIFFLSFFLVSFTNSGRISKKAMSNYDGEFVEISKVKYNGWIFNSIIFQKQASGNRIRVKYFAAKDYDGTYVPKRYNRWSYGKDIIAYTSGTYMTSWDLFSSTPVGFTVDNGKIVNKQVANLDALVVVYATGGIVVADIDEGIEVSGITKPLKIKNPMDKQKFLEWCEEKHATVFQTHLLVYKNELKFSYNASTTKRERRFLAVGKNDEGELQYALIHSPQYTSLKDGASKTLKYLQSYEDMNVTFMINLDTGGQDVLKAFNSDGSINKKFVGPTDIATAVNLLVFYWQ